MRLCNDAVIRQSGNKVQLMSIGKGKQTVNNTVLIAELFPYSDCPRINNFF